MGNRTTERDLLLEQVAIGWREIDQLVSAMDEAVMTSAGSDGWSAKSSHPATCPGDPGSRQATGGGTRRSAAALRDDEGPGAPTHASVS